MRTERAPRAAVRPTQRPLARALALLLVPVLLSACGGPERVDWPGLRFELPAGWERIEDGTDRLVLADHLAADGERGVLVTFLRVPGTLPDDWRARIAERGALLESDEGIMIAGDVPATQLVLLDDPGGTPVREVVLVVASRGLVISVAPRVVAGDQDGPELLLASLDGVRGLLDGIELAPPALG
jgi:hypothetical protein